MAHKSLDLAAASIATCVCVLLALWAPADGAAVRALIGVPFALMLPGYCIAAALFPMPVLRHAERLLLSLGLSLASAILGGLLLNLTPWGLQTGSWVALLATITLGTCIWAWRRRAGRAPYDELNIQPRPRIWLRTHAQKAILLGAATALLLGAVAVAQAGARSQPGSEVTQLCLLPGSQSSQSSQNRTARVCIHNLEAKEEQYIVVVMLGGHMVAKWPSVTVGPTGAWEVQVALPKNSPSGASLEVLLYRQDAPEVLFRHATLRLA